MLPERVGTEEKLGRRVFSRRAAKRASRGRVLPKLFMERGLLISVDRLSGVSLDEVERVAQKAALNRDGPFRGWAVVACSEARSAGRRVRSSPRDDNPYHADIVLPAGATEAHREWHAQELAAASRWQPGSAPID